jgi:hypothetical protein
VPAAGGEIDRAAAVADFIGNVSGIAAIDDLPRVVALQEMTSLLRLSGPTPPIDYPAEIARRSSTSSVCYVPTVSTRRYPLQKKWGDRWDDGIAEMEQGMFASANGAIRLVAPWLDPPRDEEYCGWVLDLPSDTFYRGTRDTEPRVATAHGVRVSALPGAQFIFVNVHLATLKEEDVRTEKLLPGDGEPRSIRRATPGGSRARERQLGVIADFIREVAYEGLRLPVVVAGDFNAAVDAPEVRAFMDGASLTSVFDSNPDHCWACRVRAPRTPVPSSFFTYPGRKEILARTSAEVTRLLGADADTECRMSAAECCRNCQAPFFSHKRNFQLIDNILYTSLDSPRASRDEHTATLKWRLRHDSTMGIRLDTHFSDHLPLWSTFSVEPRGSSS